MSIYSIPNWTNGASYSKNAIVRYPNQTNNYYYALVDNSDTTVPASSSFWGGISSFRGSSKPQFIWRSSYQAVGEHQPKTNYVSFADGYMQRTILNINNDLLTLNLMFGLRTELESAAINHFLYARAAQESFLFTPSAPHDLEKLFICKRWADSFDFFNNHSVNCIFEETVD